MDHAPEHPVHELLEEVAMIEATTGGEFDLGAVSRQAELLTRAHDLLAATLEDVGR